MKLPHWITTAFCSTVLLLTATALAMSEDTVPSPEVAEDSASETEAFPDLTTSKGTRYTGITSIRAEPDGLNVMHEGGIVKIPFDDLPEDVRAQYQYDEAAAREFTRRERELDQARTEAARQRRLKELSNREWAEIERQKWFENEAYKEEFAKRALLCEWTVARITPEGAVVKEIQHIIPAGTPLPKPPRDKFAVEFSYDSGPKVSTQDVFRGFPAEYIYVVCKTDGLVTGDVMRAPIVFHGTYDTTGTWGDPITIRRAFIQPETLREYMKQEAEEQPKLDGGGGSPE